MEQPIDRLARLDRDGAAAAPWPSLRGLVRAARRAAAPAAGRSRAERHDCAVVGPGPPAASDSYHRRSAGGILDSEEAMRADVSAEAGEFVRGHGGRLWVWAARPAVCCAGTPAYMRAATEPPPRLTGFHAVRSAEAGLQIWFRAPAGQFPGVLEIALRGRRRPRVEAYWDGCRFAP